MSKKLIVLLIAIILVIAVGLFVCIIYINNNANRNDIDTSRIEGETGDPIQQEEMNYTFKATVLSVGTDSILVEPDEEEEIRKSADQININLTKLIQKVECKEQDRLLVYYDGTVKESYPASITANKVVFIADNADNIEQ